MSKAGERTRKRLESYDQAVELTSTDDVIVQAISSVRPELEMGGVPYLGTPYLMKENDPDQKRPARRSVYHTKIFDMSVPEAVEEYNGILQRAAFGLSSIVDVERRYNELKDKFTVYVTWKDDYYVHPDMAKDVRRCVAEAEAYQADQNPKE